MHGAPPRRWRAPTPPPSHLGNGAGDRRATASVTIERISSIDTVTSVMSGSGPSSAADSIRSRRPMSWAVSDRGKSEAYLGRSTETVPAGAPSIVASIITTRG